MRKLLTNAGLVLAIVVILAVSFSLGSAHGGDPEARFAGTDSVATETIQASNPGYQPWFKPFFEPAPGEIESGLFAMQAALGGTVLGFALGALWARRRPVEAVVQSAQAPN